MRKLVGVVFHKNPFTGSRDTFRKLLYSSSNVPFILSQSHPNWHRL